MATNFEYYKDEILEIIKNNRKIAIKNGEIIDCNKILDCDLCGFNAKGKNCGIRTIEFLYEERIEQPKLTKKERLFCELVETGWIARDKRHGILTCFKSKPVKGENFWSTNNDIWYTVPTALNVEFPFIKWSDTEPWAVEDLLKLEVEE